MDYRMVLYKAHGALLSDNVGVQNFYNITEERALAISMGIAIGMKLKYKHPEICVYRVSGDNKVLISIQH